MKKALLLAGCLIITAGLVFAGGDKDSAKAGGKEKLIIVAGSFVQNNLTGAGMGTGRNLVEQLNTEKNIDLEFFVTPSTAEQQQILFRVGSLRNTEEDLIYVFQSMADDRITGLLEPLNSYMTEKPLDGYPSDYSQGMLDIFTKNGQLYAIPIRAGVWNIWYNKRILDERGIPGAPKTPEEIYEYAKQATYTKPSGEKVYGFVSRGTRWDLHEQLAIGARMYGGDIITPDYKIVINEQPVIKFLQLYRKMYVEGIMPPNWNSMTGEDADRLLKEGRGALSLGSANYGPRYNDPATSNEAGNIVPAFVPLAKELWTADKQISDSMSFTWAIAILKGSTQKEAAWDTIRFLTQQDSAIEMAKNENAPSRISVLEWQSSGDPGAQIAAEVFKYTRAALPPLENGNQIIDIIGEHMENAIIHGRDPQAEMNTAAKRIAELM
ncbi:ABC transporter substrate-binding protein [Breznakiella homolactica]|uniref:Extracellular solute-binding protein n=1 Tax=Breznakiella homolactica TaxID=2798577 RepID=A0A7T7XP74_9SPIR|nr:extracellular solute-binding protein [Breznakiella homolactica]QQO09946.1 extracellular solute-binding protein [Breznakiella homolactica]